MRSSASFLARLLTFTSFGIEMKRVNKKIVGIGKKEKISIDLDVVTVGLWEKKDSRREEALEMLKRIKNREFFVISLLSLLKLPEKWRNKILAKNITDYYFAHTDKHVDDAEIFDRLKAKSINVERLLSEFLKKRIKEEDIFLVLACSLNSSTLVTMNRRHLRGNEKTINEILKKFGLEKIKIRYPRELKKNAQRESLSSSLNLFKDSLKTALFISSANLTGSFFAGIETFFFIVKQFVSEYLKIFGLKMRVHVDVFGNNDYAEETSGWC